jgi:hypothetical protein
MVPVKFKCSNVRWNYTFIFIDVDLQHADMDPAFHSDAGPAQTFDFDANPDPTPHQDNANVKPLAYRPSIGSLHNLILGLHSS